MLPGRSRHRAEAEARRQRSEAKGAQRRGCAATFADRLDDEGEARGWFEPEAA
jgi:hypothetical protein